MDNTLKTPRLHSMDSLRACMMLLGVVLHSTETYSLGYDSVWPHDPNSSHALMNYLNSLIHIFRMPLFFVIAGFFGALLFYERSPSKMLKNRFKRLLMPFLVFLLLLHPVIILVMQHTSTTFGVQIAPLLTELSVFPRITYHLWFLYYLILISGVSYLLALGLKKAPSLRSKLKKSFRWIFKRRIVFIPIFSIVTFAQLVWMWEYWASTPLAFTPDIKLIVFYGMFYGLGWLLFCTKELSARFMKNDWLFVSLAIVIFTLKFIYQEEVGDILYGALNAVIIWFFFFGIIGLFMRYASEPSYRGRYISDSSYWVYLMHLPLTLLIPAFIVDWPVPAFVKFLIVATSTSIICFLSYHYLVRATFIGHFLNGRKYPLKKTDQLPE